MLMKPADPIRAVEAALRHARYLDAIDVRRPALSIG